MNYYRVPGPLTVEQSIQEWTAWSQLHDAGEIAAFQWETDQEEGLAMRRLQHPEVRWVPPSPPWLPDAVAVVVYGGLACFLASLLLGWWR